MRYVRLMFHRHSFIVTENLAFLFFMVFNILHDHHFLSEQSSPYLCRIKKINLESNVVADFQVL